jgi:hypothetical protein
MVKSSRNSKTTIKPESTPVETRNTIKKNYLFFTITTVILNIIAIIINFLALLWIQKLEEISCKCSENWRRDYIKYFLYAYFIMLVVGIFVNIYLLMSHETTEAMHDSFVYNIYAVVVFIFGFFGFMNIFVSIFYIKDLKDMNCQCSEDTKREVYYYYNIIKIALMVLFIILSLIAILAIR